MGRSLQTWFSHLSLVQNGYSQCPLSRELPELFKTHPTFIFRSNLSASKNKKPNRRIYFSGLVCTCLKVSLNSNFTFIDSRSDRTRRPRPTASPFDWNRAPEIREPQPWEDAPRSRPCPERTWRCESGDCIPDTARCDGYRDCRDGTDELDCPQER